MAVFTHLTPADIQPFIDGYDLGTVTSMTKSNGGVHETVYLLETQTKPVVLTLYEKNFVEGQTEAVLEFLEQAHKGGYPCAYPLRARNGDIFGQIKDKPAYLQPFLEGELLQSPTVDHCAQGGKLLADLHLLTLNTPPAVDNRYNLAGYTTIFHQALRDGYDITDEKQALIESELEGFYMAWPETLPTALNHIDFFPNNCFAQSDQSDQSDQITSVFDFNMAGSEVCLYDVAMALNAWCFDDNIYNPAKGRAFLAAYDAVRPLSDDERTFLPLMCQAMCVFITILRIRDGFYVPDGAHITPHDTYQWLERLAFHKTQTGFVDYVG